MIYEVDNIIEWFNKGNTTDDNDQDNYRQRAQKQTGEGIAVK